jgi:hypothetical protein
MNWELVESQLVEAATGTTRRFGESTVVVPFETPFPLWEAVEAALTEDESEEHVGLESWPGDVQELLTAEGALVSLLSYDWEETSGAGLDIVGKGAARRYLCWWDELESYRALAAIRPWDDPLAISATVASFIATNGDEYGMTAIGDLPTGITNEQPKLLPERVVRQAFSDVHEAGGAWDDEESFDDWFASAYWEEPQ